MIKVIVEPGGLYIDIENEQTIRRDADVRRRLLRLPAINLIEISGGILVLMRRLRHLVARDAGEDGIAQLRVTQSERLLLPLHTFPEFSYWFVVDVLQRRHRAEQGGVAGGLEVEPEGLERQVFDLRQGHSRANDFALGEGGFEGGEAGGGAVRAGQVDALQRLHPVQKLQVLVHNVRVRQVERLTF